MPELSKKDLIVYEMPEWVSYISSERLQDIIACRIAKKVEKKYQRWLERDTIIRWHTNICQN